MAVTQRLDYDWMKSLKDQSLNSLPRIVTGIKLKKENVAF